MSRTARKPRALLRGQKVLDMVDGSELYMNDMTTTYQEGKTIHKKNFDTVTEMQRIQQINARLR